MDETPDDFAFLSDDIVFDVVEFAYSEQLRAHRYKLIHFDGRWGELAHKFCDIRLEDNGITEYRLGGNTISFSTSPNNRKNVAVNSLGVSENSNFNNIKHLIADAYESLRVYCKVPKELLKLFGNRFTRIIWSDEDETNEEIDFLKRQLNSPHLRILECAGPVLTRPDFTDLLVGFVRKKNFQTLNDRLFSSKGISERIFLAAYEAWLQRSEREHLPSSVSARISTKDLHKLTARIPNFSRNQRIKSWGLRWSYSEEHPTSDHYEMRMTYDDDVGSSDFKKLTMSHQKLIVSLPRCAC